MKTKGNVRNLILCALFCALCAVLPMAFHSIPNAGTIYSPIHIPALLCGLLCGPWYGLACGVIGPLLSSVLTGMPPLGYLPPMMVELAAYGLLTGLMMRAVHTGKLYADLYISMLTAMVAGRLAAGVVKALMAGANYSLGAWAAAYFVTSLPGIIIQLVLIPVIVLALEKAKLIPARYPTKKTQAA